MDRPGAGPVHPWRRTRAQRCTYGRQLLGPGLGLGLEPSAPRPSNPPSHAGVGLCACRPTPDSPQAARFMRKSFNWTGPSHKLDFCWYRQEWRAAAALIVMASRQRGRRVDVADPSAAMGSNGDCERSSVPICTNYNASIDHGCHKDDVSAELALELGPMLTLVTATVAKLSKGFLGVCLHRAASELDSPFLRSGAIDYLAI